MPTCPDYQSLLNLLPKCLVETASPNTIGMSSIILPFSWSSILVATGREPNKFAPLRYSKVPVFLGKALPRLIDDAPLPGYLLQFVK
jgi:hypothetical protein